VPGSSSQNLVQSLARGLDLLQLLVESDNPLGITEIGQRLGVDKSTAHRLAATLMSRGLVVQDPDTHRYRPGMELVHLGRRVLDRVELRSVAQPWLRELRNRTGESAHLAVAVGPRAVYVDIVESGEALNVATEIGRTAEPHCTAIGKALLAHLSPDELAALLSESPLARFTPRTITNPNDLAAHLALVRQRGYATDDEEFTPGVRCVAAPIRDLHGAVIATMGISGPAVRVTTERLPQIGATVVECASQVSRLLGYHQGG
jgi:DNA-binding IclR family transcriptional regulator